MEEQIKIPKGAKLHTAGALKKTPAQILANAWRPLLMVMVAVNFALIGFQYGTDEEGFLLENALCGIFLVELITIVVFFALKGRTLGAYLRFQILFMAFVPHMTLTYMGRLGNLKTLIAVREDVVKQQWHGALALWCPEILPLVQVLLPVFVLVLGAWLMNSSEEQGQEQSGTVSTVKYLASLVPKWYWVLLSICLVCTLSVFFVSGLGNFVQFVIGLLLVCMIADLWERIRHVEASEPAIMIAWAQIILFLALWLKAVMQILF